MFRIGEFSKIAQTPVSQLHYYDRIGLFQPAHTDKFTSYRYYRADQLPDLNRILALKELGLSLEQIERLVTDEVSADEIRGMLTLKKAQIEQSLKEEVNRLKFVEARLRQIEQEGTLVEDDVVIKSVPAQPFFSVRQTMGNFFDGLELVAEMTQLLPAKISKKKLGYFTAIIHGDAFQMKNADLEMGFLLNGTINTPLPLGSGGEMKMGVLPSMETAVSAVRIGPFENGFNSYAALGYWVENNGYDIIGPAREVFIQMPAFDASNEAVAEILFPVKRQEEATLGLLS